MRFWSRTTFDLAALAALYAPVLEDVARPALLLAPDGRVAAANAPALAWLARSGDAVRGVALSALPGLGGIALAPGAGRLELAGHGAA
ncbi:hypothetical protein, partial [Rhodobaculum claviforme]